jgi:ribonuclease P protein component
MSPDESLPRSERLSGRQEWQAVFDSGTRLSGRYAILWWRRHDRIGRKAGFSAGKRAGPPVVRNRARRLLREAYRRMKQNVPDDCHLVLVARSATAEAGYQEVARELQRLLKRAGLWTEYTE